MPILLFAQFGKSETEQLMAHVDTQFEQRREKRELRRESGQWRLFDIPENMILLCYNFTWDFIRE